VTVDEAPGQVGPPPLTVPVIAGQVVVMFRHQLVMLPETPPESLTTYKLHVPLALNPLKIDANVCAPAGAGSLQFPVVHGAGDGKRSPAVMLKGAYVAPFTRGEPSTLGIDTPASLMV